jgi:hypothetical protein
MSAQAESRSTPLVAGYLAALSMAASFIGLAWHPLRLILPAILLAMISAAMTGRQNRLAFAAVIVAAACFFLGMTISVVTGRALW